MQFRVWSLFGVLISQPVLAISLTGTLSYDSRTGGLSSDLELGSSSVHYLVSGSTLSDPNFSVFVRDLDLDFSGIEVEKVDRRQGHQSQLFENTGTLHVGAMERIARNMTLAGVSVNGKFKASLTRSNRFAGLSVDGESSKGGFDYNLFNGKDRAIDGTRFGRFPIRAIRGDVVFDWDDYFGQDLVHVSMQFGDLQVRGKIQHSQNGESVTVSHFQLQILTQQGEEIELAPIGSPVTELEMQLRAVLAFFQVFGTDLAS